MLEESGKNEPIYFEVHRRLNIEKKQKQKISVRRERNEIVSHKNHVNYT